MLIKFSMLIRFIENIGEKTIDSIMSFYDIVLFLTTSIFKILNPKNYNNRLKKDLILKIYRLSILTVPLFSSLAFVFGSILVATIIVLAGKYNFHMQVGSLIITFIINEFSVLFTALFVALKSGVYSNQVAKVTDNYIIANVLSSIVSVVSLSVLFSFIIIISTYVLLFLLMGMDLNTYKSLVFNDIHLNSIVFLFFKAISFGFIVMIIPIHAKFKRYKNKRKNNHLSTVITVLVSIFFVEILTLLLKSI